MEMGFPEDVCAEALERYDGDENLALNYLLGGWKLKDEVYAQNGVYNDKTIIKIFMTNIRIKILKSFCVSR